MLHVAYENPRPTASLKIDRMTLKHRYGLWHVTVIVKEKNGVCHRVAYEYEILDDAKVEAGNRAIQDIETCLRARVRTTLRLVWARK